MFVSVTPNVFNTNAYVNAMSMSLSNLFHIDHMNDLSRKDRPH